MRYPPLWLQVGTYAAGVDRRLIGALWPAARGGATSGCAVSFKSGMTVTVDPGQVACPTSNSTGSTLCVSDAPEDVVVATAPGTGLGSRYDLVICQLRSTEMGDPANDDFVFTTETGAASATPSPPAVPAGAVALAQVYVAEGAANIDPANITDLRPHELGLQGFPGLDPLPASAPISFHTDSTGEVWVAKGGLYGGAWRRARDVLTARVCRQTAMSMGTGGYGSWPFDTTVYDEFGLYDVAQWAYRLPIAGRWRLEANLGAPGGAGQYAGHRIVTSTAPGASPTQDVEEIGVHGSMNYGLVAHLGTDWPVDFDDCLVSYQSSVAYGGAAAVGPAVSWAVVRYLGPR
jgi:hypothetical protein